MSDAGDGTHDVGSLADEAAKLFGAFSSWAREHTGEAGEGLSSMAAQAAAAAHEVDDHLATGSAECTVCPICRTVHAVRQLSPEVKAHLASAATSLAHAATSLMATTVPPEGPGSSDVERIDFDEEWPAGDE